MAQKEIKEEIVQFRNKSKKWRVGFYISTLVLLLVYFIFFVFVKNNPIRDFLFSLDSSWSTVIGIIGSIASTISFFYAITIAYESIINSNQSEVILSRLNDLLEKTNHVSEDTNKLVHTIADATRKSIRGKENIGKEIIKFLKDSEKHNNLLILTHAMDIETYTEKNEMTHLLFNRASDVNHLCLKLLHPEIIKKEFRVSSILPPSLQQYVTYINHLPYHLFIREKQGDYASLLIMSGLDNLESEVALFIEHDEEFSQDIERVYHSIQ
jgi:hypothetical protein